MHAQELLVDKSEAGVDRLLADYKDEYCMKWVPVLNLKGKAGEEIWRNATEDGDAVIVRSGGAAAARGPKRKPSADEAAKQAAAKLPRMDLMAPNPAARTTSQSSLGPPTVPRDPASPTPSRAEPLMPPTAAAGAAQGMSLSRSIASGPEFRKAVALFLSVPKVEELTRA